LSCVFLQQSYSDAIPDVGYMVLMDRIYLLSYILIAVIMLRVIVVGNATAWGKYDNVAVLCSSDRRRSFWLLIIYLIISLILVLLA